VSLPERHYDLAGRLLAEALLDAESSGTSPRAALERRAHERGRELGEGMAGSDGVLRVLEKHGFEPRVEPDGVVTLANCPFHTLAREHTELVCGMNLQLLDGVLQGVGTSGFSARLQPAAGRCCVQLEPSGS
jgi:predicted ArsR family transcriptional regulator